MFEGCTIVTSGIVPLNLDVMRYISSFSLPEFLAFMEENNFTHIPPVGTFVDLGFSYLIRSELGLQVISFGAKLKKKYVLPMSSG